MNAMKAQSAHIAMGVVITLKVKTNATKVTSAHIAAGGAHNLMKGTRKFMLP